MRIFFMYLLALSCTTSLCAQTAMQIAVVADKGPRTDYAQALLEAELQRSGQFALVERERIAETIKELSFQQSGVNYQSNAVAIGRHLNVHKIFFAQTHRVGGQYALTVKIVDIETNQVQRTESENRGTSQQDMQTGVRRLANRLIATSVLLAPLEMISIPAGRFKMGAEHGLPDEKPVHQVSVNSFEIDRYEVTRIAYESFLVSQGRKKQAELRDTNLPAVNVSWTDAVGYCRSRGARLPTEAEWEYACRAGTTTRWASGDDEQTLEDYAWISGNTWALRKKHPHAIGQKKPNAWGLHDMHGNVWEWVADWEGAYTADRQIDPQGPENGERRVGRGGSFGTLGLGVRSASRFFSPPDARNPDVGARIARVVNAD